MAVLIEIKTNSAPQKGRAVAWAMLGNFNMALFYAWHVDNNASVNDLGKKCCTFLSMSSMVLLSNQVRHAI